MTNPDSYPKEAQVILYRKGTAGTITYREDTDSRLNDDWQLECDENYPKHFSCSIDNNNLTSTINLLNSSCAQWSGAVTGALQLGDGLRFGIYQSDGITVDVKFKGVITSIEQNSDGTLAIVAYDYSKRLELTKMETVIYKNIRKLYPFQLSGIGGYGVIGSMTDANISFPFIELYNSIDSPTIAFGNGSAGTQFDLCASSDNVSAQPIIAQGHEMLQLDLYYDCSDYQIGGVVQSFRVYIVNDDHGVPAPYGTAIKTFDIVCNSKDETNRKEIISVSPTPSATSSVFFVPGQRYWIVVRALYHNAAKGFNVHCEFIGTQCLLSYQVSTDDGVTWTPSAYDDSQYHMDATWLAFESCEGTDYIFDDSLDQTLVIKQATYDSIAALLSYYYNTLTLEEVISAITKMNTGLLADINANCDRTFKTYATKGKTLAECLRELLDTYENSGTWDGRQHVMGHYEDGFSIQRLKVGKRLDVVNDTEVIIASLPEDRTTQEDEWIIVGEPNLKKNTRMKYSQVVVVGQSPEESPIISVKSDKAMTGGFWSKMSGLAESYIHNDENLMTQAACDEMAIRLLDSVSRDIWEGSIVLSGQNVAVWDFDTTSDSYGSGKIIKLYWSPLGISALKMKVRGAIFRQNSTEILVNNIDPAILNRLSIGLGKIERQDAFLAPTGSVTNSFLSIYYGTAITTNNDVYMRLYDESNNLLGDGHFPVLCKRFKSVDYTETAYNLRTYHAEFERQNGHSTSKVRYVELYDSGGVLIKFDLSRTESSIVIDEMIDKTRSNRLIVEFNCPNS